MKKINNNYKVLRALFFDIVVMSLAFFLTWLMEMNTIDQIVKADNWQVAVYWLIAIVVPLLTNALMGGYKVVWKYAGTIEVIKIVISYIISFVVLFVIQVICSVNDAIEKVTISFVFNYCALALGLVLLERFMPRYILLAKKALLGDKYTESKNIIIYGGGYTGSALIKRFLNNPQDGYNPVAIIDDNAELKGNYVQGVKIVGGRERLEETIKKYNAQTVAIAITEINREEMRSLYNYISQFKVSIKTCTNIANAQNVLSQDAIGLKEIKIDDLLRRKPHQVDAELLDSFIRDKVIMVTGGAGSIGSEICRQVLRLGCKHLVIFDHNENGMFELNEEFKKEFERSRYSLVMGTVRDRVKIDCVMKAYKPEIVLHAAAYKHVPMMELAPEEAIKNNVFGTKNVIEECEENGVKKFILISTDKAVNPANIMGASKRIAELILEDRAKNFKTVLAAVRFGNVLGSSGSVIPTFLKQINAGKPVTVTSEKMKRYFMTIPEAVTLVLQAGAFAKGGEVFVLDMGEPVYIIDLARDLIRLSGLEPDKDIPIVITGLRPGEKMFEELRFGDEDVDKTSNPGIFVNKLQDVNHQQLEDSLKILQDTAMFSDVDGLEQEIFKLVPSVYRERQENKNKQIN